MRRPLTQSILFLIPHYGPGNKHTADLKNAESRAVRFVLSPHRHALYAFDAALLDDIEVVARIALLNYYLSQPL